MMPQPTVRDQKWLDSLDVKRSIGMSPVSQSNLECMWTRVHWSASLNVCDVEWKKIWELASRALEETLASFHPSSVGDKGELASVQLIWLAFSSYEGGWIFSFHSYVWQNPLCASMAAFHFEHPEQMTFHYLVQVPLMSPHSRSAGPQSTRTLE